MESSCFDLLARIVSLSGSRRALAAFLAGTSGALVGGASLDANLAGARRRKRRRKKRKKKVKGPCANGKSKANWCKRDNQCCTGFCNRKRRRCRCRKVGQSCDEDRNCCVEQLGHICVSGVCTCGNVCTIGCQFSSVQDAIDAASNGDTIRLCAETYGETLTITKDLVLQGRGDGQSGTVIDGLGAGPVVDVAIGAFLALRDLRITGGAGNPGSGIRNAGTVVLSGCTVIGNESVLSGGGILNDDGDVTLNDSRVQGNSAGQNGGGISSNDGSVKLNGESQVADNRASQFGGGIHNGGALTLRDMSQVTENTATFDGGGIFNNVGAVSIFNQSAITGNTAGNNGGGLYMNSGAVTLFNQSAITANTAEGDGGGIFKDGGAMTLNDESQVTNNDPNNCAGDPVGGCIG